MTHDPRDVECAREARRYCYGHGFDGQSSTIAEATILAAKLARERAEAGGVDPLTLRARELLAVTCERQGKKPVAACYRNGRWDDEPEMLAVRAALSEGK